jgi:hypothetical protein
MIVRVFYILHAWYLRFNTVLYCVLCAYCIHVGNTTLGNMVTHGRSHLLGCEMECEISWICHGHGVVKFQCMTKL